MVGDPIAAFFFLWFIQRLCKAERQVDLEIQATRAKL